MTHVPDAVARLVRTLEGRVTPAAAVPRSRDGSVAAAALEKYVAQLRGAGMESIAIWAHTGRGPHLTDPERRLIADAARRAGFSTVIAGVGRPALPRGSGARSSVRDGYLRDAEMAARCGASALLVFPAPADAGCELAQLHRDIADATALPLIAFLLYPEAGGRWYESAELDDIMSVDAVAGLKIATYDSPVRFQDTATQLRERHPAALVITGEDRFFGPSLLWGARAALVGVAAARPDLSVALMDAWRCQDWGTFVAACARMDAFAALTFRDPVDAYVQRMLWVAEHDGLIDLGQAHDPYGPQLQPDEQRRLVAALGRLPGGVTPS